MKTVFIGHPIGGDVKNNIQKVISICYEIHSEHLVPVAPYLVSLQYLNDDVIVDRELGKIANFECFHRKFVDELWLYGDRISKGMEEEIALAKELNIPIFPKTEGTKRDFIKYLYV
ncbi:MAG: hypothetical protein WC725_02110 [Patescibacteria group bacterium]|jgi:hypothetical protein